MSREPGLPVGCWVWLQEEFLKLNLLLARVPPTSLFTAQRGHRADPSRELTAPEAGAAGLGARALFVGELEPPLPGQAKGSVTPERQRGGAGAPRPPGLVTAPAVRGSSKFLTLEFPADDGGTGKDRRESVSDAAKGEPESFPEPSGAARGSVGGNSRR